MSSDQAQQRANYDSFVEFNERTKHQINNLNIQLKALIAVDVILAMGVSALAFQLRTRI